MLLESVAGEHDQKKEEEHEDPSRHVALSDVSWEQREATRLGGSHFIVIKNKHAFGRDEIAELVPDLNLTEAKTHPTIITYVAKRENRM